MILIGAATLVGCSSKEPSIGVRLEGLTTSEAPDVVRAWVSGAVGSDAEILNYARTDFPYTGKTLHAVKAVRRIDGEPLRACFDGAGVRLADCGDAFRSEAAAANRSKHGALSAQLRTRLAKATSTTLFPVGIWLRYALPSVDRSDDAAVAVHDATRKAAVATIQDSTLRDLAARTPMAAGRIRPVAGAPALYAFLSADELEQIAETKEVVQIYPVDPGVPSSSVYPTAAVADATGFTGLYRSVCVIEGSLATTPNTLTIAATYSCGSSTIDSHARQVIGVIRSGTSPYGVAKDAAIHLATWDGCDDNAAPAFAWCSAQGARVWNFSHTCSPLDNRLFDYWVKVSPFPLVTLGSGNAPLAIWEEKACATPCQSLRGVVLCHPYNGLVVGASNDCTTSGRSDDAIACFSQDLNAADGQELPHLVAPGQALDMEGYTNISGTSASAPLVAGAAAQLQQSNSALLSWPEAQRAILMCGANETVSGGPLVLDDGVDDRDGAGLVNVDRSIYIGLSSYKRDGGNSPIAVGHDYGSVTASGTPTGSWYSEVYHARTTLSGRRLRVVLTWDSTATCTNPSSDDSAACSNDTPDADLDLYVYRVSDGALVTNSASWNNTYEIIEFDAVQNEEYLIKFKPYSWTSSSTYFGIAWYFGSDYSTT